MTSSPSLSSSPLHPFRLRIAEKISSKFGLDRDNVYNGIEISKRSDVDFQIAIPRWRLKEKADVVGQKVIEELQPDEYISSVNVEGNFLSINLNQSTLSKLTLQMISQKSFSKDSNILPYGWNNDGEGKKLVIEYSSPNIAKPFHAGHLRSTIIGAYLANLYAANGWSVYRINYLGDWGKQFGLLAVAWSREDPTLRNSRLSTDPIKYLYEIYVKIWDAAKENPGIHDEAREFFKKMEDGDEEALGVWRLFRDLSIKKYEEVYNRLGVSFDEYGGESKVSHKSMEDALKVMIEKGLVIEDYGVKKTYEEDDLGGAPDEDIAAEEPSQSQTQEKPKKDKKEKPKKDPAAPKSDPAVSASNPKDPPAPIPPRDPSEKPALLIDLEKYKLGKTIVRKKDGAYLYITRDIGGAVERWEKFKFDKMVYVAAAQQDLHFAQFFKVLELMEYPWASRLQHVNFGMVLGMSTRKGTAKFLEDIMDHAKEVMHEQMAKNQEKYEQVEDPWKSSDLIGMTGIKVQDMVAKRINSYSYSEQRMFSFEGDTGPYLQYAHVRLCSVERKSAPEITLPDISEFDQIKTELLTESHAHNLVFTLAQYPDVVKTALKEQQASTLVNYLFKLAHAVSSAWEILQVKGSEVEVGKARLLLFVCAREVLNKGMKLLTIEPIDRM